MDTNTVTDRHECNQRLSAKESAEYLGVTRRTLNGLRYRRQLPYFQFGYKTFCFDRRDLDAYLRKVRVRARGEEAQG
jgi:excisionase family DNA binding protein